MEFIGYLATLILSLGGIFQIVKTIKDKSVEGISGWFFINLEAGLGLMLIYSIYVCNTIFILSNVTSLIINTIILIQFKYYKR
jgi:uncharacterized protein with PQ loop repeat